MKTWYLKLHRWIALAFALPLVLVLGTGLVLSLEPWFVTGAIEPGSVDASRLVALIEAHDPDGQARGVAYRAYDGTLTVGSGRSGGTIVDVASGELQSGPSTLATTFGTARRLHEHFLFDAGWVVVGSTISMLLLALIGVLMGLPKLRNTLAGWHKGVAWILLPLVVLSPLTGLLVYYGVSFATPSPVVASGGPQLRLQEAVRLLGASHDPSTLVWLRPAGERMLARLVEDGEYRVYSVTREGTEPMPRNWPRLLHEGNFAGGWSASMNLAASLAMIGLLGTGTWLWLRRQLRHRTRVRQAALEPDLSRGT